MNHLITHQTKRANRLPILLIFVLLLTVNQSSAVEYVVTNTYASGPGSLAKAIFDSNNNKGQPGVTPIDEIRFDPSLFNTQQTISIDSSFTIDDYLIIKGPGKSLLTIKMENSLTDREMLRIRAPQVDISGVTFTVGNNTLVPRIIYAQNTSLILKDVDFIGNSQLLENGSGSAIALNYSELNIKDCQIENFVARFRGGAIFGLGSGVTMDNCAVVNNWVEGGDSRYPVHGGGLYVEGDNNRWGSVEIINSEFSGNSSPDQGGAIHVKDTNLAIINTTISGNSANNYGGGIAFERGELNRSVTFTIFASTIFNNKSINLGGGIYISNQSHALILTSSIVAGNSSNTDPEISMGDIVASYSLIGDSDGDSNGVNYVEHQSAIGSVLTDTDPMLAPLADNGGSTRTHAINDRSPLINIGHNRPLPVAGNFEELPTDQRGQGYSRVIGGNPDIGAYEKAASSSKSITEPVGGGGGGGCFSILSVIALLMLTRLRLTQPDRKVKNLIEF